MSEVSAKPTRLGDITTHISSGSTPRGGAETYLDSGPVMLIRSQNVRMNGLTLDDVAYITDETDRSMKRSQVQQGDVLLNITGASIGRVACFEFDQTRANVNQHVCIIRPKSDACFSRYLTHLIASPEFQANILRIQHGGTRQALTFAQIAEFKIPLPPLSEQKRIAEILDRAEALRAKRRAALALLDELTQSIFLDMFGEPVRNPKNWKRVKFGDIIENIDSGWSPKCLDRPVHNGEWGVLKLGAVTWCEYDPSENKALPPEVEHRPELEVHPGDLLFTRKNTYDLVAACALVRDTPPRLMLPDLVFRFRLAFDAPIDSVFLQRLLVHPAKRRDIQKLAGGSSGSMPNISKSRLQTVLIELPPLELQKTFAARVNSIEKIKESLGESTRSLDALFVSLQHRAFRGEL